MKPVLDLIHYVQQNALLSTSFAVLGSALMFVVQRYRGRVKTLEYRVNHQAIGFSANDAAHGKIEVTWRGNAVANLFLSTLTVTNDTSVDFKDLIVVVWSPNETVILTEQYDVPGSAFLPQARKEYAEAIEAESGGDYNNIPERFYHRREYVFAVFNRGKTITIHYLTSVPNGGPPYLWMNTEQQGLEAVFRQTGPEAWGVPINIARWWGIGLSLLALPIIYAFSSKGWGVGLGWFAGATSLALGAMFTRTLRTLTRTFLS
jgi:hypothetical protein